MSGGGRGDGGYERRPYEDSHHRGRGGHMRGGRGYHHRSRSRSRSGSPPPYRGGYRNNRGGGAAGQGTNNDNNSSRRNSSVGAGGGANPENENGAAAGNGSPTDEAPRKQLFIQRRKRDGSREGQRQKTFSIHISNLPFSVDRDQLRGAFNEFGKVLHSSVSLDEAGKSRGFGVIEYETREAAEEAVTSMDKATFNGRDVTVRAYDLQ